LIHNNETLYIENHGNKFDNNNILELYDISDQLGQGGFGSVHKATHKETGQIVAIKYIDITECSIVWNVYV